MQPLFSAWLQLSVILSVQSPALCKQASGQHGETGTINVITTNNSEIGETTAHESVSKTEFLSFMYAFSFQNHTLTLKKEIVLNFSITLFFISSVAPIGKYISVCDLFCSQKGCLNFRHQH